MGRIQSNVGLITGLPIGDTVDKLMQLAARPHDMLVARTDTLKTEQVAITELSALLLAIQYASDNLSKDSVFDKLRVTSSNEAVLGASVTGQPAAGIYQFTPLRIARNDQWLGSGLRSDTEPLGGGQFTFRFGDHVERSASLDLLGGGAGFAPGKIRITDRSGATAEIDLSTAQTVDDVLEAINASGTINVTAAAEGDHLRLIDHTGQTLSNLRVQEVGRGTTAASLGLDGIDTAASTADGRGMLRLGENTALAGLNDGNGFAANTVLADVRFHLRDGTTGEIDFSPIIPGGSQIDREVTLGDVLTVINAAAPGKLKAEIAPDGKRLVVTDLTQGGDAFSLESLYGSTALEDLGLDVAAAGDSITGRRILGGMKSVLLASLNGGKGLGTLGDLQLTDRLGASATVDLSAAETLEDVVAAINAAGVGIRAGVNDARNGVLLADTTGAASGPLVVASGDATGTAEKLQLASNADVASVNSGDLHLQVVGLGTRLSGLNGGAGVARGRITLYDSQGRSGQVNLAASDVNTVGDVIQAINRLGLDLRAEINAAGDGILLKDTGQGGQTIRVVDQDSHAAADLHLLGSVTRETIDGVEVQLLDGSTTQVVTLDATTSLGGLAEKINALGAGVTARVFADGSANPYRLLLGSNNTGRVSQLVVDASGLGFTLDQISRGRDALLALGTSDAGAANVLIASPTNEFLGALPGVRLQIKQPSSSPVTITVDRTDADVVANVKALVENYNRFRKKLLEDTAYDAQTDKASVLTGDAAALRLDAELSELVSRRFPGTGPIQSLAELGIRLSDDGTLELDEARLKTRFADDPQAVKDFFQREQTGFSARVKGLIQQLAGEENSLLSERLKALGRKIEQNLEKIDFMSKRLDLQRERLLLDFYRLEMAVSKIQSNLGFLDAIQWIEPVSSSSSGSA